MELRESYEQAVAIAGAFPTVALESGAAHGSAPCQRLRAAFDPVDESYRNVAPKGFVALLDSRVLHR